MELTKDYLYKRYVVEEYSMPEIAKKTGYSYSNIRYYLTKFGIPIRSRKKALNTERAKKKISEKSKENSSGKYVRTQEVKNRQSNTMLELSDKNASGISLKPSGYYEITKGVNKGKNLHVVLMENQIGRSLKDGECVHHIDRDKTNNDINNLALMTHSAHARLHRFEDELEGISRKRNKKGQYT